MELNLNGEHEKLANFVPHLNQKLSNKYRPIRREMALEKAGGRGENFSTISLTSHRIELPIIRLRWLRKTKEKNWYVDGTCTSALSKNWNGSFENEIR